MVTDTRINTLSSLAKNSVHECLVYEHAQNINLTCLSLSIIGYSLYFENLTVVNINSWLVAFKYELLVGND